MCGLSEPIMKGGPGANFQVSRALELQQFDSQNILTNNDLKLSMREN